jgi:hypothetical protein
MAAIPPKQDMAIAEGTALRRLLSGREDQVFLVLMLLIGALVGLVAVAFILLTERVGQRLYPTGGAAWHRLVFPVVASLVMGYLLYRYFPSARGSGVQPRPSSMRAKDAIPCARCWENLPAPRLRFLAAFRSAAKARRCRLAQATAGQE